MNISTFGAGVTDFFSYPKSMDTFNQKVKHSTKISSDSLNLNSSIPFNK